MTPRERAQYPNEPWLWRSDWAQRAVRETPETSGWCLWGFTIAWCLFSIPLGFFVHWQWPMDARNLLMAAFPIAGALLLLVALYQTLRAWKYGVSVCRIDRVPIPLGSTLRGEIDVRLRDVPASGFTLRLASVRRTVTGSGKSRSTHENLLWQDEQTITHGAMPSPRGLRVPFHFDIPWDCEPADFTNASDVVVWRLHVSAEVPGVDYQAQFELPVFRTEDARDELAPRVHSPASWQPPREITIAANTITVRSCASVGNWVGVLVFYPIWFAVLAVIRSFGAPLAILAFFALFSLFLAWFLVDFLIGRTTITIDRSALQIHRTWLGLGRRRALPASDIAKFETRMGMTIGNRGYHDVHAVFRDGRTRVVAKHIRMRKDAEMLGERLAQMAGL